VIEALRVGAQWEVLDYWDHALEGDIGTMAPLLPFIFTPSHAVNDSLSSHALITPPKAQSNRTNWPWNKTFRTVNQNKHFFFLIYHGYLIQ
jgi:hypothetical protein